MPGASRRTRVSSPGLGRDRRLGLVGDLVDQADGLAPGVDQDQQGQVAAAAGLEQGVDGRGVERRLQATPYRVSVGSTTSPPLALISPPTSSSPGHCSSSLETGTIPGVVGPLHRGHGRVRQDPVAASRSGWTATPVNSASSRAVAAPAGPRRSRTGRRRPGPSVASPGARRRSTSRPSGPPSGARRGSWSRTSVGRVAMAALVRTARWRRARRPARTARPAAGRGRRRAARPRTARRCPWPRPAPPRVELGGSPGPAPGTAVARKQAISRPAQTSTAIRGSRPQAQEGGGPIGPGPRSRGGARTPPARRPATEAARTAPSRSRTAGGPRAPAGPPSPAAPARPGPPPSLVISLGGGRYQPAAASSRVAQARSSRRPVDRGGGHAAPSAWSPPRASSASRAASSSMILSRPPFSTPGRSPTDRPMRWSVTRSWGEVVGADPLGAVQERTWERRSAASSMPAGWRWPVPAAGPAAPAWPSRGSGSGTSSCMAATMPEGRWVMPSRWC